MRRSWWALGAFAIGLWLGQVGPELSAGGLFAAGGLLAALALLVRGRLVPVLMLACVVLLGAGWWGIRQRTMDPASLGGLLAAAEATRSRVPLTLEGTVLDSPVVASRVGGSLVPGLSRPSARFELRVREVAGEAGSVPASGIVQVTVQLPGRAIGDASRAGLAFRAGDRVRVTGMASGLEPPNNPGQFDFRVWARDRGRVGWVQCPEPALVSVVAQRTWWERSAGLVLRARGWLGGRALHVFERAFPSGAYDSEQSASRALAMSLILGRTDPEHGEIDSAFNRLGLAHILAISGFHIVVLAWVGLQLIRLTGERGMFEPLSVAVLVLLYLFIVPAGAPVVRAGVMTLAMLGADALGRRYDRLTLLGWIGVALLIWRPGDVCSLGFPLSLGLTAALLWSGGHTHERLWGIQLRGTLDRPGRGLVPWTIDRVKELLATSVLCWSLAMPLLLERVGLFSPAAVISTVLVTPLVVPGMAVGFGLLVIGMVVPGAADWAGPVLGMVMSRTLDLVFALDAIPGGSVRVVGATPAWAIGATVLVGYWHRAGYWRNWRCWAGLVVVGVWLVVLITRAGQLGPGVELRVDTLAVGDGACHIVREHSGRAIMIDCGSTRTGIGRRLVPDALRALGVRSLDAVILTRPDPARFAALADVAASVPMGRVLVSEAFEEQARATPLGAEARLLESLPAPVEVLDAGRVVEVGSIRIESIWPEPGAEPPVRQTDRSMVVRISAAIGSMLFTSDIRKGAIDALVQREPGLHARIVEAPAHGAPTPEAVALVRSLGPRVVIQSSGDKRAGDERWDPVRERAAWLQTATDGACWAEILADGSVRWGSMLGPTSGSSALPRTGP